MWVFVFCAIHCMLIHTWITHHIYIKWNISFSEKFRISTMQGAFFLLSPSFLFISPSIQSIITALFFKMWASDHGTRVSKAPHLPSGSHLLAVIGMELNRRTGMGRRLPHHEIWLRKFDFLVREVPSGTTVFVKETIPFWHEISKSFIARSGLLWWEPFE